MDNTRVHFYKVPVDRDPLDYETFCRRTRETLQMLQLSGPNIDKLWEQYLSDTDFMGGRDYEVRTFTVLENESKHEQFERIMEVRHPDFDLGMIIPDWYWPETF